MTPAIDLPQRVRVGASRASLDEFYAAAYPRLVATLRRVHPDAAEEIAQDAFIRLLPRWKRISSYDDPEAWLRRVAFRLGATHARRQAVLGRLLRQERPRDVPGPNPDGAYISELVTRLPMHQRQVVVLFYLYDKSLEDIAAELAVSVGTVKSRLSRARTALQETSAR